MSDETPATSPAPAGGSPSTTSTAGTSAPSGSTPAASGTPAAGSAAAPASSPYAWDKWDGEDSSAPEQFRPALTALRTKLKPQLDELGNMRKWYDALAEDDLEPITQGLRGKVETQTAKIADLEGQVTKVRGEFDAYKQTVQKEIERVAAQDVADFEKKNAKLLANPKALNFLTVMVTQHGADPEAVVSALELGQQGAQAFVNMKRRGASDEIALEHAKIVASKGAAAPDVVPRAGARLVNGADGHTRGPSATPPPAGEEPPKNLREYRSRAVDRAFKKHNLG